MESKKSVLFICLGNICRSPIAEAVFLTLINKRGVAEKWLVDSAALGPWHVGNYPDPRALAVLKDKNIKYSHTVRQIKKDDFRNFDYIFGMDEENMASLKKMAPKDSKATTALLGTYDPEGEKIIEDPYYDSGSQGFYKCYDQCIRSCEGFLNSVD
ncbi:low molecular weight phosphotyrosine protein phosphatase 1-like isoform X2 [Rhodnius prolixus]|uniref:Low molecular weight phosphotyrosine protein phosphatase n=2 Tax=Rhodnius prolixus TaxID=13249 RepID=T1IAS2_RHOPR